MFYGSEKLGNLSTLSQSRSALEGVLILINSLRQVRKDLIQVSLRVHLLISE